MHAIGRSDAGRSDEQIRALATRGGVMGITAVNFFVSKKPRSAVGGNFMRVYGEILG